MRKIPNVAVLLETSHPISREMMLGIIDYVREHEPWNMEIIQGGTDDIRLPDPATWKGNGIIGRLPSDRIARSVAASGLPTVLFDPEERYVRKPGPLSCCSTMSCDSTAVGNMAAEYLLSLGYENFAFVPSVPELDWSRKRENAFVATLSKRGISNVFIPVRDKLKRESYFSRWLKSLPKPIAVFAANDVVGRRILKTAMLCNISIPAELSVLGVNNDAIVCETSLPRLSSIGVDARRAGYVAAGMLARLMTKGRKSPLFGIFPPSEVFERESTDIPSNGDAIVAAALRIIREDSASGLRVGELASRMHVSVRSLESRFHMHGLSIRDEISRRRLAEIKRLVSATNTPFSLIAEKAGFATVPHFTTAFKRAFGCTPGQMRLNLRKNEI